MKIQRAGQLDYEDLTKFFYSQNNGELAKRWSVIAGIRDTFTDDLTEEEKITAIRFRTKYLGERGQWFVVKDDKNLVAAAIALDSGELESIRVDDKYLQRSIATMLSTEILNFFKLKNYRSVRTVTDSRNTAARALFNKLGFVEIELRKDSRGGEARVSVDLEARI